MQMTGVSSLVAPLATGHPLGLPAMPAGPATETRVQPSRNRRRREPIRTPAASHQAISGVV